MDDLRTLHPSLFNNPVDERDQAPSMREDWEDWDSDCDEDEHDDHDEEVAQEGQMALLPKTTYAERSSTAKSSVSQPASSSTHWPDPRLTMSTNTTSTPAVMRSSAQKPSRLKSRARQKAQNAKAGIRLVTDMSKLRKQQLQQQQMLLQQQQLQERQLQQPGRVVDRRTGKFVDAAALLALEGKPSDASVGTWHWLRRRANSNGLSPQKDNSSGKQKAKNGTPTGGIPQDLSPNDRPIVIGISLPEDDLVSRTVSPQTATIETPVDISRYPNKGITQNHVAQLMSNPSPLSPQILRSVWSPDTEDGSPHSASVSRAASSVYSRPGHTLPRDAAPPVPSLPSNYRGGLGVTMVPTAASGSGRTARQNSILLDGFGEDDADTPITLFEEDGSPASYTRMSRARGHHARSLATTIDTTRSGWWDHVQTPFGEHSAHPFSAKTASPVTPASARTPVSAAPAGGEEIPAVPAIPALPAVPIMPAIQTVPSTSVPTVARAPTINSHRPSPAMTADGWWEEPPKEEMKTKPTTPPLVPSNRPALGISTAKANAFVYRQTERSPTVASSSLSAVPTQQLVTPRATPRLTPTGIRGTEKAIEASRPASSRSDRDKEQDQRTPADAPPPYESPARPEMVVRYRAVFPPGHPLRADYPPSPNPVSPGLAHTMTSQGAIHMSDVPLTPAGVRDAAAAAGRPLPHRPSGALLPGTAMVASEAAAKVERRRRRHEKEDNAAQRVGNLWRGRGCLPRSGCLGRRRGRESRKRRRLICMGVVGGLLFIIVLITVLAVTLTRKHTSNKQTSSFWLNVTNFPPVPTGVTTVVGTDNAQAVSGCVQPSTLWSCALPKEQQAANQPFAADEPSFVIEIQFDNSTQELWNVPDGTIPTPVASATGKPATTTTSAQQFDAGFSPQPVPPSFQEMWFLGNTTDGIVSARKAGEPTPFYITLLTSVNATAVGPNKVVSRGEDAAGVSERSTGGGSSTATTTATSDSASSTVDAFPAPSLNADGTGAPAAMRPFPVQQPLRLFDRGLPTEHYGFYTYFSKTIYVQSIEPSTTTLASDANGGSLEVDANHVVTWLQTRFLVQIWTRMQNTTQMLGGGGTPSNITQPGTFPYPITITEDLHGGDFAQKGIFARAVDAQQQILLSNSSAILDNLAFGGTLINHGPNPTFGGTDGGTGGCKCVWNNFVGVNGNTVP